MVRKIGKNSRLVQKGTAQKNAAQKVNDNSDPLLNSVNDSL